MSDSTHQDSIADARMLCVPGFDPEGEIEVWWTGRGLGGRKPEACLATGLRRADGTVGYPPRPAPPLVRRCPEIT